MFSQQGTMASALEVLTHPKCFTLGIISKVPESDTLLVMGCLKIHNLPLGLPFRSQFHLFRHSYSHSPLVREMPDCYTQLHTCSDLPHQVDGLTPPSLSPVCTLLHPPGRYLTIPFPLRPCHFILAASLSFCYPELFSVILPDSLPQLPLH